MCKWPLISLTVTSLLVAGCGKKNSPSAAGGEADPFATKVREKEMSESGLVRQSIDLDADDQAEIFNFYRERADAPRLLVKKEIDLNRDGRVDVISYFDGEGRLEKEEMDGDYDGVFDWTDHYQDGFRVMSEYDTDFDGVANVWKYYIRNDDGSQPRLDRKERDTDGDGQVDVWERFNASGEVIRTGRDTDGDGKMDVREE
jgi:hypothetical protein